MTREQTKEAIRIMQAFVDGKEVQFKWGSMGWSSTDKPEWNWSAYDYRIKPTAKLRPWTAETYGARLALPILRFTEQNSSLV